MTNREYYKEQIVDLVCSRCYIAFDKQTNTLCYCSDINCENCLFNDGNKCCSIAFKNWLDSEYVAPKTKTEKFCETLKAGEVIAVSDTDENLTTNFIYIRFNKYDKEMDKIRTSGFFKNPSWSWNYGRKLTAEERGEKE